MITTNDFCKKEYGEKLYKISFDAGFTCPNRDGKIDSRGCIFCSAGGSGDFAVKLYRSNNTHSFPVRMDFGNNPEIYSYYESDDVKDQIQLAKEKISGKYKGDRYIAYFQAFTNTYADVATLRNIYLPIISRPDIAVLSIATRPDCISDATYGLLEEFNKIKPVWVELGLQTTKEESISYIRRGYDTVVYDEAVKRLNAIGIHTITHIILYLPGESKEDMLSTVNHALAAGSKGLKLSLLHIIEGTDLANDFYKKPFKIPSLEEYAATVKACVDLCPEDIVIHRITGDAPKKLLIEPKWSANKKVVLNTLNRILSATGS